MITSKNPDKEVQALIREHLASTQSVEVETNTKPCFFQKLRSKKSPPVIPSSSEEGVELKHFRRMASMPETQE